MNVKGLFQTFLKCSVIFFTFFVFLTLPITDLVSFGRYNFSFQQAHAADANGEKVDQEDIDRFEGEECGQESEGLLQGNTCKAATVKTSDIHEGEHNTVVTEKWLSMLLVLVAAMVTMLQLGCVTCGQCGWTTAIAALGSVALLVGEILSLIYQRDTVEQIEYRQDKLSKYRDKCIDGTITEEEDVYDGGFKQEDGTFVSVCDQYAGIHAQMESYKTIKEGMEIKKTLFIAAGAAFGVATVVEIGAWIMDNGNDAQQAQLCQAMRSTAQATTEPNPAAPACRTCVVGTSTSCGLQEDEIRREQQSIGIRTEADPEVELNERTERTIVTTIDTACAACTPVAGLYSTWRGSVEGELQYEHGRGLVLQPQSCPTVDAIFVTEAPKKVPDHLKYKQMEIAREYLVFNEKPWFIYEDDVWKYFQTSGPMIDFIRSSENTFMSFNENEWSTTAFMDYSMAMEGNYRYQDFSPEEYFLAEQIVSPVLSSKNEIQLMDFFIKSALGQDDDEPERSDQAEEAEVGQDHRFQNSSADAEGIHNIITKVIGFLGIGVAILVGALGFTKKMYNEMFFNHPGKRALWYAIFSALIFTQTFVVLDDAIQDMDARINALGAILLKAGFEPTVATTETNFASAESIQRLLGKVQDKPIFAADEDGLICACGGDGKNGCKENCNAAIDVPLSTVSIPDFTTGQTSLSGLANDLAGERSLTSGATANFATLAGSNAAIQKAVKKAKLQAPKLKDKNGNDLSFADVERNAAAKFKSGFSGFLKSKGVSAADLAQQLAPSLSDEKKEDDSKKDEVIAKADTPGKAEAAGAAKTDPFAGMTFKKLGGLRLGGDDSDEVAANNTGFRTVEGLEVPDNDIGSNSDADIFKMLTIRYMKSAYPLFFEEDSK